MLVLKTFERQSKHANQQANAVLAGSNANRNRKPCTSKLLCVGAHTMARIPPPLGYRSEHRVLSMHCMVQTWQTDGRYNHFAPCYIFPHNMYIRMFAYARSMFSHNICRWIWTNLLLPFSTSLLRQLGWLTIYIFE